MSRERVAAALIALMLLVCLALLEGITREVLVPASNDMSRFPKYPERARDLAAAPVPRIALVGNSTTERGMVLDVLSREWEAHTGAPPSVDMFVANDSSATTWYWMLEHNFWKRGLKPDLLVITYFGDGLADTSAREVGRIAQFFSDPGDLPELFATDFTTLEQRADYLLSSASQTFAARDRIRLRTLDLIPGFQNFNLATNTVIFEHEQRRDMAKAAPTYTYSAFHRLIDRAQRQGVKICFVAFPQRPKEPGVLPYEISPQVLEAITAAGMLHLDLRRGEGLTPAMYEDDVHLNAEGRNAYTQKFVAELVKIWPTRQSETAPTSARTGSP